MSPLVAFLCFVAFAALAPWLLVRWLGRDAQREQQAIAKRLEGIKAIPLQEAIRRADTLLNDVTVFRCETSIVEPSTLGESIAPLLRAFLGRYKSVETASGQLTTVTRIDV